MSTVEGWLLTTKHGLLHTMLAQDLVDYGVTAYLIPPPACNPFSNAIPDASEGQRMHKWPSRLCVCTRSLTVCGGKCVLQGFSTGLPERLQLALLRTLPGLESCSMLRPAYAVEYDYLPAHQCSASLETKKFKGLFFSGQLNGTTGEGRAQRRALTVDDC